MRRILADPTSMTRVQSAQLHRRFGNQFLRQLANRVDAPSSGIQTDTAAPNQSATVALAQLSPKSRISSTSTTASIKRDGDENAFQLREPSLLNPTASSFTPSLGEDLHLDPAISMQMQVIERIQQQLALENLRNAILNPDLSSLVPANPPSDPLTSSLTSPTSQQSPPVSDGPTEARPGTLGDIFSALLGIPVFADTLTNLKTLALNDVSNSWGQLDTGGKIAAVSATGVVAGGALAAVLSNPGTRQFALGQLNGRVIPLGPVGVELNYTDDQLMFGLHFDVGSLLPKELGFGRASFNAIGGPPKPEREPWLQPKRIRESISATPMIQRAPDPLSLTQSIDPTSLSEFELSQEISRIRSWLADHPESSADAGLLSTTLHQLEAKQRGFAQDSSISTQPGHRAKANSPRQSPPNVVHAAHVLRNAMDGWGTDEDAIFNVLKSKSKQEIDAIKHEYKERYERDLEVDLRSELSGAELDEALAHLSGDKAAAAISSLVNSIGTLNDDEEKIEQTLTALEPADLMKLRKQIHNDPQTYNKIVDVLGQLDSKDYEAAKSLLKGDRAAAAAIRLDDAISGVATDEKVVYQQLEHASPEEREQIKLAYRERTGRQLDEDIANDFSGAEYDLANALLSGNQDDAIAARLQIAGSGVGKTDSAMMQVIREWTTGLGTDEEAIYSQFKGKSESEREKIAAAYQKNYGSIEQMFKDEFSDTDLEQASQFKSTGKLDPVFALKLAMEPVGTDEELIKETLGDLSKEEIAELKQAYLAKTGRELESDFTSELTGRDYFDVNLLVDGNPTTPEEYRQRALKIFEFERGTGSNDVSVGIMDFAEIIGMHSSGSQLEFQTQRLLQMFDEHGQLKPEFTIEDVKQASDWQQSDASDYSSAKNAVVDALSTGSMIAVGALTTFLTYGALSPWLAATIAGAIGGAANIGVRAGLQGDAYGGQEIAVDAVISTLSAAVAGVLSKGAVLHQWLDDLTTCLGDKIAKKVAFEALKEATGSAINEAGVAMMNDEKWREGFAEYVANVLASSAVSGAQGAVGSVVPTMLDESVPDDVKKSMLRSAGIQAVGAMGGEASKLLITSATYQSRLEDVLNQVLTKGVKAGSESLANNSTKMARLNVIAESLAYLGDDMPRIQEFLTKQTEELEAQDKKLLRELIVVKFLQREPMMPETSYSENE